MTVWPFQEIKALSERITELERITKEQQTLIEALVEEHNKIPLARQITLFPKQ